MQKKINYKLNYKTGMYYLITIKSFHFLKFNFFEIMFKRYLHKNFKINLKKTFVSFFLF